MSRPRMTSSPSWRPRCSPPSAPATGARWPRGAGAAPARPPCVDRAEDLLAVSAGRLDRLRRAKRRSPPPGAISTSPLEVAALALVGRARASLGECVAAEASFAARGVACSRRRRAGSGQALVLLYRSRVAWARADYRRAAAAAERALAFAEGRSDRGLQSEALLALGRIEVKRGAYDDAEARLQPRSGPRRARRRPAPRRPRARGALLRPSRPPPASPRRSSRLRRRSRSTSAWRAPPAGRARSSAWPCIFLFQGDAEDALAAAERSLRGGRGAGRKPRLGGAGATGACQRPAAARPARRGARASSRAPWRCRRCDRRSARRGLAARPSRPALRPSSSARQRPWHATARRSRSGQVSRSGARRPGT